jgi:hypothetical protein
MGSAFLVWDTTPASTGTRTALALLCFGSALLYATGYGINIAANAVGRLVPELAPTQPSLLIYFLDEHLGHILWHLGMVGVTVALTLAARAMDPARLSPGLAVAAAAYAFAYFTDAVEGQTVPLLLPISLVLVAALGWRRPASARPLLRRFVLLAHALALAMFAIWGVWQGGFPQFSEIWGI